MKLITKSVSAVILAAACLQPAAWAQNPTLEGSFDSYLEHGFTPGGFFRERVYFDSDPAGYEDGIYSIRRQSESIYAILLYLDFEKRSGRSHPEWENRISALLDRLTELQNEDGSFPRKFSDAMEVKDPPGGSSSSAILPLTMGYRYFGDKSLLKAAERTAEYLETGLISEADYFGKASETTKVLPPM